MTIKQIEKTVKTDYPVDTYMDFYGAIVDAEFQIEWLKTKEAEMANGTEMCQTNIKKNLVEVARAKQKLDFLVNHFKLK